MVFFCKSMKKVDMILCFCCLFLLFKSPGCPRCRQCEQTTGTPVSQKPSEDNAPPSVAMRPASPPRNPKDDERPLPIAMVRTPEAVPPRDIPAVIKPSPTRQLVDPLPKKPIDEGNFAFDATPSPTKRPTAPPPPRDISPVLTPSPTRQPTAPPPNPREERTLLPTVTPSPTTRPTAATHTGSKEKRTKVLLVCYYRGGSTLLGSTLKAYEGSFYWFEPLLWMYKNFVKHLAFPSKLLPVQAHGYSISGQDPTAPQIIETLHHEVREDIRNILNCDFAKLRKEVLTQKFLFLFTKDNVKRQQYGACVKISPVHDCIFILEEECKGAKVVVAKTIRLSVNLASKTVDDDTLIVYQSRDPRGILASRFSISGVGNKNVARSARELCSEMMQDYHQIQNLALKRPKQILILKYEDLAKHPSTTTAKLFSFVGQPRTQRVTRFIMNQAYPRTKYEKDNKISHSAYIAGLWQKRLRPSHIEIINQECKQVLQAFGYMTQ